MLGWCIARIPDDKRPEWEFQMQAPLPWQSKRQIAAQVDDDGASFMAAMGQLQGG